MPQFLFAFAILFLCHFGQSPLPKLAVCVDSIPDDECLSGY